VIYPDYLAGFVIRQSIKTLQYCPAD